MNDKIFRKLRNFCFRAFLAGVAASLSFGVAGCHGKHEHEHEGRNPTRVTHTMKLSSSLHIILNLSFLPRLSRLWLGRKARYLSISRS